MLEEKGETVATPQVVMGANAKKHYDSQDKQPESAVQVNRDNVSNHIMILTIAKNMQDGSMQVSGPIENKFLCYGMLEESKDVIRAYADKRNSELKIIT